MQADKKLNGVKKFLSYYAPYKALFIADMACSALAAALALALPICVRYVTGPLLGALANTDGAISGGIINEIIRMGAVMAAIIVAQTGFSIFYDYKGHDIGAKIERDMRMELFEHFQELPFGFYDGQKTGQLMSRLVNDLWNMAEMCHHTPENVAIYGTQFIGSLVILFILNRKLTLIISAIIIVMASYSIPFYRKTNKIIAQSRQRIADVNSRAEENLSGIRTVKSFAAERRETEKFRRANDLFYKSQSNIYKYETYNFQVVDTFLKPLITIAIITAGGIWAARGELASADLLIFIMYAAYLTAPIPSLAFMVEQVQDGMAGYRRFREIVDIIPEIRDADGAAELNITRGNVVFDNVTFRYTEEHEYVLRCVNLNVASGETVAIVGRSGIGKTTLCSLIPRFYDAGEGEIRIDGICVRDVTQASLRRQIGIVRQETFLFAGTVAENILYGKPDATEREVEEAAKKANAHDFISELPDGYGTDIGQRGIKLSGGQQQRICIARVFLRNPRILILDEATSALDYESERAVMQSLKRLSEERTTFIIAHRLSTVRNADRIIVLSEDGISEQGSHEELYALGGEYAKLYDAQEA